MWQFTCPGLPVYMEQFWQGCSQSQLCSTLLLQSVTKGADQNLWYFLTLRPSILLFSIWKDLLHRGDRAMIYLFIAGSYTPWLNLRQLDGVTMTLMMVVMTKVMTKVMMTMMTTVTMTVVIGWIEVVPEVAGATVELRWAVWLLATLGILYQQIFHERCLSQFFPPQTFPTLSLLSIFPNFPWQLISCHEAIHFLRYKALETTFYVVIALLPSLAVYEMVGQNHILRPSYHVNNLSCV